MRRIATKGPLLGAGEPGVADLVRPTDKEGWLALGAGSRHRAVDLAEDGADAGGNIRHDCTGGHSHETCHQSVFDEVLTVLILPNLQFQYEIRNPRHICLLLFLATDYVCPLLFTSY